MATYQSTHTGAEIDAAVDAVSGKADLATTLSGYGITDAYTKTESDTGFYAIYGGINLNLSETNTIDLDSLIAAGSYYNGYSARSQYCTNRPTENASAFRVYIIGSLGSGTVNIRQRYQEYDKYSTYERYTVNGGTTWSTWRLVQANLANYASASDVTTLQGYFTNGVANSAATAEKLSAVSKTAWGQTYWTSNGVPDNISGNMTGVGSITASDNIYLANAKHIYAKDSGNTNRSLLALSSSNALMLGYGLASVGSTYIYGNSITVRIGGTATANNAVVINSSGNTTLSGTLTIGDCEISYANNKLNFSNGVVAVFSGSTAPSSSTGSDGDIYIQTS